jgi:hypothetical protein
MLVLIELGCSVPALQVGLVGRTDHFLLHVYDKWMEANER